MSAGTSGKKQSNKPSTTTSTSATSSAKTVIKKEGQAGTGVSTKRRKVQSGLDEFYGSDSEADDADGVSSSNKCMLFDDDEENNDEDDDKPVPEPEIALTKTPLTKRTLLALVYPSAVQPPQEEEEEEEGTGSGGGSGRDPVLVRLMQTKVGEQVSIYSIHTSIHTIQALHILYHLITMYIYR